MEIQRVFTIKEHIQKRRDSAQDVKIPKII